MGEGLDDAADSSGMCTVTVLLDSCFFFLRLPAGAFITKTKCRGGAVVSLFLAAGA